MTAAQVVLPIFNTACLFVLIFVVYHKERKLRLQLIGEIEKLRAEWKQGWESHPPIFVGETFLAERLEHIDQQLMEQLARIKEIERAVGLNGAGSA